MRRLLRAAAFVPTLLAAPLAAQTGNGTTGGSLLQLPAGSRAPALGGAAAAGADADALFYNPAAGAWLARAASLSYQQHVEDIAFGSVAATARAGPVALGLTFGFLDLGAIDEVVPDPDFDGQRGRTTGDRVEAGEGVLRAVVGLRIGNRIAVGAAAGALYASLAETGRIGAVFDGGVQYRLPRLVLGAALRNAGSPLSGAGLTDAPLPTELRIGAATTLTAPLLPDATLELRADALRSTAAGYTAAAAGIDLSARLAPRVTASLRTGYDGAARADLGRVRFGGGLQLDAIAVDYTAQQMQPFGTVHRLGIRWTPPDR